MNTTKIDQETLRVLSRATISENTITLTCGQLDRKQYVAVNKVLEGMGGKWNRKLAAHIFESDPTNFLEQVLLSGEIVLPKKQGFFPTPPELAERIVKMAHTEPGDLVLEPSAGQGGIADYINKDCIVDCIEILPANVEVLRSKGYNVIYKGDFLQTKSEPMYNRVIMNPPFEKQADIDHVLHAWEFLVPGGRLVSIMAAGVLFRENKKTVNFRELIEKYGFAEKNSPEAFKSSGTMVNTVIVVLNKPKGE